VAVTGATVPIRPACRVGLVPASSEAVTGPPWLRRATTADLPAIKAIIAAAYAKYLSRMDKQPAPMFSDYGPSVEDGYRRIYMEKALTG
jgi:hypothetical protein